DDRSRAPLASTQRATGQGDTTRSGAVAPPRGLVRARLQPRDDVAQPVTVGPQQHQLVLDGEIDADPMLVPGNLPQFGDLRLHAIQPLAEPLNDLLPRPLIEEHQADVAWNRRFPGVGQATPQQCPEALLAPWGERIHLAWRPVPRLLGVDARIAVAGQPIQDGVGSRLLHRRDARQVSLDELVDLVAVLALE